MQDPGVLEQSHAICIEELYASLGRASGVILGLGRNNSGTWVTK
jgi:hypothetical protein